jgi:hypothetical protein
MSTDGNDKDKAGGILGIDSEKINYAADCISCSANEAGSLLIAIKERGITVETTIWGKKRSLVIRIPQPDEE